MVRPMPVDGARQFEMQSCLGSGGFGEVYKATMTSTGGLQSTVAVKVLRSDLEVTSDAVQRLRDEGRALGRLDHPSIVRAYDLTVVDRRVALVTEFIDGQDLDACVPGGDTDQPPMGVRALLQVVGAVADALDAAWNARGPQGRLYLVHRDIKPSNIRIGRHGQVKLLDFGIARFEGHREARTASDVVMGSLPFMAPERFVDRRSRSASDVFSLGCCLYEGLSGQRFYDDAKLTVLSGLALDAEAFDALRQRKLAALADVPAAVRELSSEMLAFDPEQRPEASQVAARCEALGDEVGGPSLRRWCADRSWQTAPATRGSLEGQRLREGTLSLTTDAPSAASDAAPPRMMMKAHGTLDPTAASKELNTAKEAMAGRRVDTPVAPPAFPSIPLGMAVEKGDQISFEELEESVGSDTAAELASRPTMPTTPSDRALGKGDEGPPDGISTPLPPEPTSSGNGRLILLVVVAMLGLAGLSAGLLTILAALGILAISMG